MKKLLIIIFISTLAIFGFDSSAQIKKELFGVTIGVSKKNFVSEKLFQQGYGICTGTNPNSFRLVNDQFAGYFWSSIKFYFYKDVLFKVVFEAPRIDEEEWRVLFKDMQNERIIIFDSLKASLSNKYSKYDKGNYYSDGVTKIYFDNRCLIYENISLAKKEANSINDDL